MRRRVIRALVVACLSLSSGIAAAAGERQGKMPRADLYGDPLPDGAVARLGSIRLRHAGLSDLVSLPDGKAVLSAGSDRVLRFWDVATGRPARAVKLQGTAGPGECVTLSPEGKTLVAQDKGVLVFWEVDSGKEIKTLPGPKTNPAYLYFSPDGRTLAVGAWGPQVIFWDWKQGKQRQVPLPPRKIGMDSTFHGSFSPDGKWFVAGGGWGEALAVCEVATGREVQRLNCNAYTSTVSPDSKRLAVSTMTNDKGGRETVLRLFDLAGGTEVAQFPQGHDESIYALAFSPDGKLLACGRSDRGCLLDCATGRVLHHFPGWSGVPTFAPDGKTLIVNAGQRLRLWDVATGKELHDRPGDFGSHPVLAVSPDGKLLASADWMEQVVSVWDTASGRLLRTFPLKGERRYVRNLAFFRDGRTLVAGQGMGFLQFWDVATGREQRTVQLRDPNRPNQGSAYFYQLHVSPDGKQVSTLERILGKIDSTRLALWETATGKLVRQQGLRGEVRRGSWSANGMTVALPLDGGLSLVEVDTGLLRLRIPGVSGGPLTASPDDRLLAARRTIGAGKDQTGAVAVWETATGKEVTNVATGRVDHLALAPDNRSLVTTDEGSLRVFDLALGKERYRRPLPVAETNAGGSTFVSGLLLSPDGRRAFTALADGTALVWDLGPALRPAGPLVKGAGEKELAAWWADLAGEDAGKAYAAVWRLAEVPGEATVAFLRKHLRPAVEADFTEVRQLIGALDSATFEVRNKAFKQLEELGNTAVPALRAALEKNPREEARRRLEMLLSRPQSLARSPEILRRVRALQVLEGIASDGARHLLTELAKGVAHAAETQEAQASLERLSSRAANPE